VVTPSRFAPLPAWSLLTSRGHPYYASDLFWGSLPERGISREKSCVKVPWRRPRWRTGVAQHHARRNTATSLGFPAGLGPLQAVKNATRRLVVAAELPLFSSSRGPILRQKCSGQSASFPLSANKLQTPLGILQPLTAAAISGFFLSRIFRLVVLVWRGFGSGKGATHGSDLRAGTRHTLSVLCNRLPATHDMLRGRLLSSPSHTPNKILCFRGRISNRIVRLLASTSRSCPPCGETMCRAVCASVRACECQRKLLIMASVEGPVVFGGLFHPFTASRIIVCPYP
jgi:hypothetical protein